MTFQHDRVLEHIDQSFVLGSKVVDPGYIGPTFGGERVKRVFGPSADPAMTETEFSQRLLERIPSATANNDVALVFATSDGQVVHVIPGIWSGEDCAKEMDYALELSKRIKGLPLDEQHSLISSTHRERLAGIDNEPYEGLGLDALKNSLETTANDPARNILELPEQEAWESSARRVGYPYRTLNDMGWMETYIVSHTVSYANKRRSSRLGRLIGSLDPRQIRMNRDKKRCRKELGHAELA